MTEEERTQLNGGGIKPKELCKCLLRKCICKYNIMLPRKYVLFILLCVLTEIIVISRTTAGVTRFAFSEETCENETDTQKALKGKFSHPSHIKYYRFSQVLYCGICMLHWFEYAYLFYGIFCFFYRKNKNDKKDKTNTQHGKKKGDDGKKKGNGAGNVEQDDDVCAIPKKILQTAVQPVLIVCFFVGFLAISVTPPAIDIALFHNQTSDNECDPRYIGTSYLHQGLTILTHIITVLVRFTFVIAATMCGNIWTKYDNVLFNKEVERNFSEQDTDAIKYLVERCTDEEAAANRYATIMDDYRSKVEIVKPIYKIYRSWFVLQWIHYIYRLSHDLVYLLRPWFWKEKMPVDHLELFLARNVIVCIYDILVILTSYLPALKMNSFLRHYIRKQQEAQEDDAKNKIYQRILAETQYKIKMIKKSNFVPRIPGFGGGMPLEGPGFLIGTVIIIVGSVATFSL